MGNDIKWTIEPDDVEWQMDWDESFQKERGKPATEMIFESSKALAHLLLNDVVHINSYWWKYETIGAKCPDGNGWTTVPIDGATWTKDESRMISVSVNCNDLFAWGCADSEPLPYSEIENVYRMWRKDPSWGAEIWCIIQRKELPQRPVEEAIRAAGVWNLDALRVEHGLRSNYYDGASGVVARMKYKAYAVWEKAAGRSPLKYAVGWWEGWKRFTEANPSWCNSEWNAHQERRLEDWRRHHGWTSQDKE